MAKSQDYKVCLATIVEAASADLLLCNAGIERDIDDDIIRLQDRQDGPAAEGQKEEVTCDIGL